jgi:hypothetical protein
MGEDSRRSPTWRGPAAAATPPRSAARSDIAQRPVDPAGCGSTACRSACCRATDRALQRLRAAWPAASDRRILPAVLDYILARAVRCTVGRDQTPRGRYCGTRLVYRSLLQVQASVHDPRRRVTSAAFGSTRWCAAGTADDHRRDGREGPPSHQLFPAYGAASPMPEGWRAARVRQVVALVRRRSCPGSRPTTSWPPWPPDRRTGHRAWSLGDRTSALVRWHGCCGRPRAAARTSRWTSGGHRALRAAPAHLDVLTLMGDKVNVPVCRASRRPPRADRSPRVWSGRYWADTADDLTAPARGHRAARHPGAPAPAADHRPAPPVPPIWTRPPGRRLPARVREICRGWSSRRCWNG